ncbi:MAG: hypothetical protein ACFCUS_09105 [Rubrimonas sp.]|uniref:hypothetical protein n=1 Tax=Rubrimonas sp. TaxID=2036015 RepID=UPI002FDCF1CD
MRVSFLLLLALAGAPASGEIVAVEGPPSTAGAAPEIIAAPASTADRAPGVEAWGMVGFDEAQGATLAAPLAVDGGAIPAGTRVDSHMILLNAPGGARVGHGLGAAGPVVWRFGGEVLGVMSDPAGALEAASAHLGASATAYPAAFPLRGLERDPLDGFDGDDWYRIDGATLSVGMSVSTPGDWIRVISRSRPEIVAGLDARLVSDQAAAGSAPSSQGSSMGRSATRAFSRAASR